MLTPKESEKLNIFVTAELSRRRKNRGLKLNHPEALSIIADHILEGARDGRTVHELMSSGKKVLSKEDVLPGVAELIHSVQVEATFEDGTKLVTIHDPIVWDMIPGQYFTSDESINANVGKSSKTLSVRNTGDRPIQVGSHAHFFEANKALEFPRTKSYGCHLNIPSGTSIRFEPGESKEVEVTEFGGKKIVYGFNGLVNGKLEEKQEEAFQKAAEKGFKEV